MSRDYKVDICVDKNNYSVDVCDDKKDYNSLIHKPQINGVTLVGNKTSEDLELQPIHNYYNYIKKVEPFTYEILYTDLDYDYAKEYFSNTYIEPGACSSFRNGNWYGRSFDWHYSNDATFIVRTPRIGNRFATIGVSGSTKTLTEQFVDSKEYSELYKIVPFRVVDGFNEYGVFCNTNVVPAQKNHTTGTTPLVELKETVCDMMLPRFILDHFKTATEAVEYIRDYVSVTPNADLLEEHNYDLHIMVLDKTKTYVVEFIGDQVVINEHTAMTNFFVSGVDFDNNKVYTPEDHSTDESKDPASMGITSFGAGLERYNLIIDNLSSVNSKETAENLLGLLKYTNAYKTTTSPRWYTEVVGEYPEGRLTVSTSLPILETAWQAMKATFDERSRDTALTWQTVHSCVYDIENKKLYLENQESGIRTEYNFDYYTAEQVDGKLVGAGVWEPGTGLHSAQLKDNNNNALGEASVAQGAETDAHSYASHTEGYMTSTGVSADYSHAEGYKTSTQGVASHAEGDSTVTNNPAEHAEGRYNRSNMGGTTATNTLSSIGIGNASGQIPGGERKNAVEVMQNGDIYVVGVGGYDGKNINTADTLQEAISSSGGGNVDDVYQNGVSVLDENKIARVTVPTKTSDITNDSGYTTQEYVDNHHDSTKQNTITSTNKLSYSLLSGTPTIPNKTSQLTNDSNYITQNDIMPVTSFTCELADGTTKTLQLYSRIYSD